MRSRVYSVALHQFVRIFATGMPRISVCIGLKLVRSHQASLPGLSREALRLRGGGDEGEDGGECDAFHGFPALKR